jgi:uncharacterized protein (TIGR03083 family)
MDGVEVYNRGRYRVVELVEGLSPDELGRPAPATPGWTVADVLAHLVGVAADVSSGNVEGAPGDEWTAKHVAARRGAPVADLVAEWAEAAPKLEAVIPHVPQLVGDVHTHEQDIRGALGLPGADAEMLGWVVAGIRGFQDGMAKAVDLGPAPVTAPSEFEWFRAALGRRSRAQVAAWNWTEDSSPWLDNAFFVFGPRSDDLVEADPLTP